MRKMARKKVGCYFHQHLVQQVLSKCPPLLQLTKEYPKNVSVLKRFITRHQASLDEDSEDPLLQVAIGSKKLWPNLPPNLRSHFNGVKMHATMMEGALQATLDSRVVQPRKAPNMVP